VLGSKVAGLAYLVPNPADDQGYVDINGVVWWAMAIELRAGANATLCPLLAGKVAGSAYFVPKPADHGYVEMNGVVECAIAINLIPVAALAKIPIEIPNIIQYCQSHTRHLQLF
jgi:hypothetical protein